MESDELLGVIGKVICDKIKRQGRGQSKPQSGVENNMSSFSAKM